MKLRRVTASSARQSSPGKAGRRLRAGIGLALLLAFTAADGAPPPNDDFAAAEVVSGASVRATASSLEATWETGEPYHAGDAGGHSLWWSWTAPATATFVVDTIASDFDTTLAVYTGTAVDALSLVVANDDASGSTLSRVILEAVAGTTYHIAVDGFDGRRGAVELRIDEGLVRVPEDFATIQEAIDAAVDGETVLVGPGVYDESIIVWNRTLTVASTAGPGVTVIGGEPGGRQETVRLGGGSGATLHGFTVTVAKTSDDVDETVVIDSSSVLTGNRIIDNPDGDGILVAGSPTILDNLVQGHGENGIDFIAWGSAFVSRNRIVENGGAGLSLGTSDSASVINNLVAGNLRGGISLGTGNTAAVVQNVIVLNAGLGGIASSRTLPGHNLLNNTIVHNVRSDANGDEIHARESYRHVEYGPTIARNNVVESASIGDAIHCESASTLVFISNDVFAPAGSAYSPECGDPAGSNGNRTTDPLLVDRYAGDYRLGSGSPAIDAGDGSDSALPALDFDGLPRITDGDGIPGAAVDLGAFEHRPEGVLGLAQIELYALELDGSAVMIVRRLGGSAGAATVDFRTVPVTAEADADFIPVSGTLSFADGDAQPQTIVIPLVDDGLDEGPEAFRFVLEHASGAALGRGHKADVVIVEPIVDLRVNADTSSSAVGTGEPFTLTAVVENLGNTSASETTLTITFDQPVAVIGTTSSSGSCGGSGPVVCNLGTLTGRLDGGGGAATVEISVSAQTAGILSVDATVAAVGPDTSPADNTDTATVTVETAYVMADFFPLEIGRVWTYVQDGQQGTLFVEPVPVVINGVSTTGVSASVGFTDFYTNDDDGLRLHADELYDPDLGKVSFTYSPAIEAAPAFAQVGTQIDSSGQIQMFIPGFGTFPLGYTTTSRILAFEQVTVPAGTFDALKIDVTARITGNILGVGVDETQTTTYWLVENIGAVKLIESYSGETTVTELTGLTPTIESPAAGAALNTTTQTFQWNPNDTPVTSWYLYAGTSPGAKDIHDSGALSGATLTHTVTGLPYKGETVHVRFWYQVFGRWLYTDYTYIAVDLPDPQLDLPAPGSTLSAASVDFSWITNGVPVSSWYLYVGTSPGASDIHDSGVLSSATLTRTVNRLPYKGETVHVRLWYQVFGSWLHTDQTYIAVDLPDPELDGPTPGSTLSAISVDFSWITNGVPVSSWYLYVGTSPGASDIHDSGALPGATLARTVTGLPFKGETVYVRLWYQVFGRWLHTDHTYIAVDLPDPELDGPTPGSTLDAASVDFSWITSGVPVSSWYLYVGTSPGVNNIHDSGVLPGATLSHTVTGLPYKGETVHVRLWYQVSGSWLYTDYTYIAVDLPDPQLDGPAPGSTLSATSVDFSWISNGVPVSSWYLYVGTSPGAGNIHDSGALPGATLSHSVTGLPYKGETVHVRLYWRVGSAPWQSADYSYTAVDLPDPQLGGPAPGSTLSATSVDFSWITNGVPVSSWYLYVGTSPGASNIHDSGALPGATLARTVTGLPFKGETVHVRLYWRVGSAPWQSADYAYTAVDLPDPQLDGPAPGSTLGATSVDFSWITNGVPVSSWYLYVGTSPGASNIHDSGALPGATLARTVTGLPFKGEKVHVRLYWRVGSAPWQSADYAYTAVDLPDPQLDGPAPGATLGATSVDFSWISNGVPVSSWYLYVGTSPGASNIHDSGALPGATLARTVTGLPFKGETLYVRLWYQVFGSWLHTDHTYIAVDLPDPQLDGPAPGSTLDATSVHFSWITNGVPVSSWYLYVGTSPGASNIHDSGALSGATLARTVNSLPYKGETVYVRLYWRVGSAPWQFADYAYTAVDLPDPQLDGPAPGSTLGATSVDFSWITNGVPVSSWYLYVGTSPGASNIHNSGALPGATLSHTVTGLPFNGETVYVRLWYQVFGSWLYADYTYIAVDLPDPELDGPTPGSTLDATSVNFSWITNGVPVSSWYLYVGTSPGANNIHDSGVLSGATLARTVNGLPGDGSTVHVRLYWRIGSAPWQFTDYQYTATQI